MHHLLNHKVLVSTKIAAAFNSRLHSSTERVETHVRKYLSITMKQWCAYSGNADSYCRRDEIRSHELRYFFIFLQSHLSLL